MSITVTPAPLPPELKLTGPSLWDRERTPLGQITYTRPASDPFVVPAKPDGTKPVVTSVTYNLFLHKNDQFSPVGTTLTTALTEAVESARINGVATGLFQAADGAYYTHQLEQWFPKNAEGKHEQHGIVQDESRYPRLEVPADHPGETIDVTVKHPDLKAVVGINSWIDAFSGANQIDTAA